MKKLALLLTTLFLLSLLGCKASDLPEAPPQSPTLPAEIEPPSLPESVSDTMPSESIQEKYVVNTQFFSLTLPEGWDQTCVPEIFSLDGGRYSLILSERGSYVEFGGGTLCSLVLLPSEEDYTFFPSYEYLGQLDTPEGSFHLVILYPTDVQYIESAAQQYSAMFDQLPELVQTLTPKDGCQLITP